MRVEFPKSACDLHSPPPPQPTCTHCCGNTLLVDHATGRAQCDRSRSPGQTHRERECHARKPHEAIVGDGQEGQSSHDRCEPGHGPSCNLLIPFMHGAHGCISRNACARCSTPPGCPLNDSPQVLPVHRFRAWDSAHLVSPAVSTHDRSVCQPKCANCQPARTLHACHALAFLAPTRPNHEGLLIMQQCSPFTAPQLST